ncbi:MAG TPA: tetratricopeptide repeat protein [Terriglobales bacterium]|nr:tetratricopeptide repeat protein [Terriglobales bacterium]
MRVKPPNPFFSRILPSFLLLAFSAGVNFAQAPGEASSASFESLAKSADGAREAGKLDDAIHDYKRALQMRPDWAEGWWYLGTTLYDSDRYSEAIPAFQKLVDLAPSAGQAWSFLGLCEYETKEYADSLYHLKRGLILGNEDDPQLARVSNYHLALLLNRSGEFEQAVSVLAASFGQSQFSPQAKVLLGLALLRVPLVPEEVDPSLDALVHGAGEAAAAIAQRDSVKALRAFSSVLKDNPNTPYLHYAYGKALAFAARDEDALAQQREETRVSPKSSLPWIEMSQLQLRLHHSEEASQAAAEGVKLAPDSSSAHRALGQVLQALGEKERAAIELEVATKLAPEKSLREEAIISLYSIHAAVGTEGISQGAANLTNTPSPMSFGELAQQAAAAQAAGNTDLAIESYQKALQLRPEWPEGRWSLAMLSYSSGRFPEAIAALKILVERMPNLGTAWAMLGLAEFEMKDYSNALIHLQRGDELGLGGSAKDVRLAKYRLAILLNRSGQFEEAIGVLASVFGQGTIDKEIRIALGMALLRISLLPAQLEPAKTALVESAGDVTMWLTGSKYNLALPKLQALLKEYPATPFLHYAYGTALAALSEYDEAEVQLRKESEISPESELPYITLASIALKRHRAADAMAPAQRSVELAPDSPETHYLLGRAYLDLGHEEKAVHELEVASKLAPSSPKIHFNLAKAYAKAMMPEKAEEERAIFARLNALAEQQRSRTGSQAYGAAHSATDFTPVHAETDKMAPPIRP